MVRRTDNSKWSRLSWLFAFAVGILLPGTAVATEPSVEAFASLPSIEQPQLSPSGAYLAFINNAKGHSYLITQSRGGGDAKFLLTTDNQKYLFRRFRWVGDSHLLVSVVYPERGRGVLAPETRMISIRRQDAHLNARLGHSSFERKHVPQYQDVVVGQVPGDAGHVLMALDFENPTRPDVYRVNLDTGARRLVQRNPGTVQHWITDRKGEVRAASGLTGRTWRTIVKPPGTKEWKTLQQFDASSPERASGAIEGLLGFDTDAKYLYVTAHHEGRQAVFRVDISDPAFRRELVAADPVYDIDGELIYAPWSGKVVGAYLDADGFRSVYWDDGARGLQRRIDQSLPGRANIIVDSTQDGTRHIIRTEGSLAPPQYYLVDLNDDSMGKISDAYPALRPDALTQPREISFLSRDGVKLRGYLTLPAGEAAGGRPAILFPHGGPAARDTAAFDYWTQYFSSRGWAVLQVNFRGSSGFGHEFMTAGFRRWGLEMQDDLTDGVRWMIDQGFADPSRMCIVGASYGGYAALMGAAKTPELYRCAVSFAGVSDLRDLLVAQQNFTGYEVGAERMIGEWWADRERLRQTSPVNHAKSVRIPILIVHGKEDYIVPVEQSRDMVAALRKAGNAPRYVELPLGDHYLSREEDRRKMFEEMDLFLKAHLD